MTDSTYNLFTVAGSSQIFIVLSKFNYQQIVNDLPIQMELDTDASLSLLKQQTHKKVHPSVITTGVQLKTYTGEVHSTSLGSQLIMVSKHNN